MGKSFLQSKSWLDFQKSLGRTVWQIEGALVIKCELRIGKSYLYSPYCESKFFSASFLKEIKEIAKKENAIFFKAEPINFFGASLQDYGFIKAHNIQPQKTIVLDITKSEQELLDKMHYKTRYNIGLAEKKGIKARKDRKAFEEFWKLMEQTTKRDGFRSHPKKYYEKLLEIPGVELFIADYNEEAIVANIVVFYEKTAIYLHGASDYEHRNLMAAPLLQWEQIREAKRRGCIEYDFWGIDETKWPGVTRFKKGFSGREIVYPGAYDLIFQPFWYKVYKIARKIL
jgi:peptidoglycan pentaglycine glycine transferase (the first glycine)